MTKIYNVVNVQIENINYRFRFKRDLLQILEIIQQKFLPNQHLFVDVLITSDSNILKIGADHGKHKSSIDVLSFPLFTLQEITSVNFDWINIGQIVFSLNQIRANAKSYNHSLRREFAYLYTHSLLHLLGFVHETLEEEKNMHKICEEVLFLLKITR